MEIVLYEPEIPQNTGNLVRLSAATGCGLHLIEPLGFFWNDKHLKRSGLDYWELARVQIHRSYPLFTEKFPHARPYYLSTKAKRTYADIEYKPDDILVFGPETRGLPENILNLDPEHCLRVPMLPEIRSLNLANSVAIVLYEALRQQGFKSLV